MQLSVLNAEQVQAIRLESKERPFWRSLDELAESPEFEQYIRREYPHNVGEWNDPVERRSFLKLMAASLGLLGISQTGCQRPPEEKIVPYVRQPEDFIPGKPQHYASIVTHEGYATGVLVESHLGRPTKIEGNPEHPASLGATDAMTQASILSLYDPDRSQTIRQGDLIKTWGDFLGNLAAELAKLREKQGAGMVILTETVTSPTLGEQLKSLLKDFPKAKWIQYEPLARNNVRAGMLAAFGEQVEPIYHFERAEVVISLDAEFLVGMPGSLRYARDFISRRIDSTADAKPAPRAAARMNRLYTIESTPTLTGAAADHRVPLQAGRIVDAAKQIATALQIADIGTDPPGDEPLSREWLTALVADLQAHRGSSLVIAGEGQPPIVHILAHAVNRALDNIGKTVEYIDPVVVEPVNQLESLRDLTDSMRSGEVEVLFVLGGNPVYNTPQELGFAELYAKARWRVHLSEYLDETSYASHWHIPLTHYLEAWSDGRAYDGTISVQQPLIAPLYSSKSTHEFLSAIAGQPDLSGYTIVREAWKKRLGDAEYERRWNRTIHDGLLADSASKPRTVEWKFHAASAKSPSPARGMELTFAGDPTIGDGRWANNGWLQELPKPLTKLTWDNAVHIAPQTATRLQLADGDVIRLTAGKQSLEAPVLVVPGQPVDSLALALGYGRTRAGRIGTGVGVDAYVLRPATPAWFQSDVQVEKTGRKYPLSVTQNHFSMEGRDLIKVRTLDEYRGPDELIDQVSRAPQDQPTLYPAVEESAAAWGMVINQTACIGCNACVTACQAENNIPIVGKEQVAVGREMHWIRIDRYFRGEVDSPETYFQPLTCMHCENAPCELVCPVGATVHSHEGLNQMVYNRCVGTRYCSNNCPYKVRRFNFLDYRAEFPAPAKSEDVVALQHNPDVTVRSRGVMEKCTYCVQRISAAKIDAQKENRPVRDGEIVTACQGACPTQAISFGNIHDPQSRVAQQKESLLNYSLLAELNTIPRTTYLATLRNPNPVLGPLATFDTPTGDPTALKLGERKRP
jgi:MoCo/4Fe-4S cofactor protein with predicted Tat translocation signal